MAAANDARREHPARRAWEYALGIAGHRSLGLHRDGLVGPHDRGKHAVERLRRAGVGVDGVTQFGRLDAVSHGGGVRRTGRSAGGAQRRHRAGATRLASGRRRAARRPLRGHDTATRERGVVLRNLSKVGPDSAVCAGSADRPSDRAIAFTRKQRSPWPGAWPHAVPPPASLAWGDLRATLNSSWATY
jgi:hypothetical protein